MDERAGLHRRQFLERGLLGAGMLALPGTVAAAPETPYRIGFPLERKWRTSFEYDDVILGTATDTEVFVNANRWEGENRARVIVLDRETGSEKRAIEVDTTVSIPLVADDVLYFTANDRLFAKPADDLRTTTWKFVTDHDWTSWPERHDETVVVPAVTFESEDETADGTARLRDGALHGVDGRGREAYRYEGWYPTRPWAEDGTLYFADRRLTYRDGGWSIDDGKAVAFDTTAGSVSWETDLHAIDRVHLTDTHVIAQDGDTLRAYDRQTGDERWTYTADSSVGDYTHGDGRLYVAVGSTLTAVDLQSRSTDWRKRFENDVYDVAFSEDVLFVGDKTGHFQARDPATGERVWHHDTHSPGNGYEDVDDGELFTVSGGVLVSFTGKRRRVQTALGDARSRSPVGEVAGVVADPLGRERLLDRAETAIENERYDRAQTLIAKANTRQTVGTAALAAMGLTGYSGARRAASSYQRRQLSGAIERVRERYPIDDGALAGVAPRMAVERAAVVADGYESGVLGASLRTALLDDDPADHARRLDELADCYERIEHLSKLLDEFPEDHPVREYWTEQLRSRVESNDGDLADELATAQSAIEIAVRC